MKIGKTYTFEAAHDLPDHAGKCHRLHGHTYTLEVEVKGDIKFTSASDNRMIMDFADLDAIVYGEVIGRLDHTYLNDSAIALGCNRTTAEELTLGITSTLQKAIDDVGPQRVSRVRLYEGRKAYAEWTPHGV